MIMLCKTTMNQAATVFYKIAKKGGGSVEEASTIKIPKTFREDIGKKKHR
jgi:hypothetical protein